MNYLYVIIYMNYLHELFTWIFAWIIYMNYLHEIISMNYLHELFSWIISISYFHELFPWIFYMKLFPWIISWIIYPRANGTPEWENFHLSGAQLSERRAFLGIMGNQLKAPWIPRTSQQYRIDRGPESVAHYADRR